MDLNANPMLNAAQEKRIIVDGNEVILRIGNVPVVKSLQQVVEAGQKLQADLTAAKLGLLDICEEESKRLDAINEEIISLNSEVEKLSEELGEELRPTDPRKKILKRFNRLQQEQQILESHIKARTAVAQADMFSVLGRKAMRAILEIACPATKITDAVLDSVTFNDAYEIVEAFIKVNRLDILPKKLIPQGLREQILKLASGEV